ncbi:MAG: hypothetical protein IT395_02835 [Candidatus Omnitrophica bacterium]|nr:hypothetical protein [Candidatus Omnitrophota bacterium]
MLTKAKINSPLEEYHRIARIVMMFWLAGWYIKISFYAPYLLNTTRDFPILHPMFPSFFQAPNVADLFYFLPVAIVPLVFFRRESYLKVAAVLMVVCSAVLNLHINTCNDATFVTSFWVGLWVLWFLFHCHGTPKNFRPQAKNLALCILGVIFLGGFVGKLTPEYWSGQVMSDILFAGGLKTLLGQFVLSLPEDIRQSVMVFLSRLVIILEGILVFTPFLPVWFVLGAMCCILLGFSFFSTWMISSVLLCLLGLVFATVLLEKICPAKDCRVQSHRKNE